MRRLFRKVANYFGFCQLWRVVLVRDDGTRLCVGTMWDGKAAHREAVDLTLQAYFDYLRNDMPKPGQFVAEKVEI